MSSRLQGQNLKSVRKRMKYNAPIFPAMPAKEKGNTQQAPNSERGSQTSRYEAGERRPS